VDIVILIFILLAGCDDGHDRQPSEQERQERELMSDPLRALPELERRLRERVTAQGRMLVLAEGYNGVQVVPMPIPWKLHCSFEGIDVVFIYGGGEDDRIKVDLTGAALSDEECRRFAPTIAEKVVAILQQQ
jgi:hypothetical protein